jgi:hypothetical protein
MKGSKNSYAAAKKLAKKLATVSEKKGAAMTLPKKPKR